MRRGRGIPGISIFKLPGRKDRHHKWAIEYQEPGKPRPTRRCISVDYEITRRFAVKVSRQLDEQRLGLFTDRDRKFAENALKPLLPQEPHIVGEEAPPSHLEEYVAILRGKRRTPKHCQMMLSRVELVFREAEFEFIDDITSDAVDLALGSLADEREWSDQNVHHYLDACRWFSRWMRRSKRARFDELEDMAPRPVVVLVRKRRALDEEEITKLLAAAEDGEDYVWWGSRVITGEQRQLVYILALETGLRANELRNLTPDCFIFDQSPRVIVEAIHSKHRHRDELPLRTDTAKRFSQYLATRRAGKPIWALPDKPYLMMSFDLERAGIAYRTLYGVADFHALRHTFCTRIGASASCTNTSIKACQQAMRHGDIEITAQYMHATLYDQLRLIDNLRPLATPDQPEAQKATGTDGRLPFQQVCQEIHFPKSPASSLKFPLARHLNPLPINRSNSSHLAGVEPATFGSVDRRLEKSTAPPDRAQLPPPQASPAECKEVNDIPTSGLSVTSAGSAGSEASPSDQSPAESSGAALAKALTREDMERMHALLSELLRKEGGSR